MSDLQDDHVIELEAVGLLLAGALAPQGRREVERHLRACDRCRDELVDIASLPALLRRLPDPPAPTVPAPVPGVRARLITSAQTRATHARRRRRRAFAAAAVLPVLLAGALVVAGSTTPTAPELDLVAMQRVNASADVDGALAAQQRSWGTAVTVRMRWAKDASAVLVVVGKDGTEQEAGSWRAPAGTTVTCTGATSMAADQVARWEVRAGTGAPLLVLPA